MRFFLLFLCILSLGCVHSPALVQTSRPQAPALIILLDYSPGTDLREAESFYGHALRVTSAMVRPGTNLAILDGENILLPLSLVGEENYRTFVTHQSHPAKAPEATSLEKAMDQAWSIIREADTPSQVSLLILSQGEKKDKKLSQKWTKHLKAQGYRAHALIFSPPGNHPALTSLVAQTGGTFFREREEEKMRELIPHFLSSLYGLWQGHNPHVISELPPEEEKAKGLIWISRTGGPLEGIKEITRKGKKLTPTSPRTLFHPSQPPYAIAALRRPQHLDWKAWFSSPEARGWLYREGLVRHRLLSLPTGLKGGERATVTFELQGPPRLWDPYIKKSRAKGHVVEISTGRKMQSFTLFPHQRWGNKLRFRGSLTLPPGRKKEKKSYYRLEIEYQIFTDQGYWQAFQSQLLHVLPGPSDEKSFLFRSQALQVNPSQLDLGNIWEGEKWKSTALEIKSQWTEPVRIRLEGPAEIALETSKIILKKGEKKEVLFSPLSEKIGSGTHHGYITLKAFDLNSKKIRGTIQIPFRSQLFSWSGPEKIDLGTHTPGEKVEKIVEVGLSPSSSLQVSLLPLRGPGDLKLDTEMEPLGKNRFRLYFFLPPQTREGTYRGEIEVAPLYPDLNPKKIEVFLQVRR